MIQINILNTTNYYATTNYSQNLQFQINQLDNQLSLTLHGECHLIRLVIINTDIKFFIHPYAW